MAEVIDLFVPKWAATLSALNGSHSLLRSQCRCCGIQQRADIPFLIPRWGAMASPAEIRERCTIVACHGAVFYLAARTYGRQWIVLAARDDVARSAPPANALTLELVSSEEKRRRQDCAQNMGVSVV